MILLLGSATSDTKNAGLSVVATSFGAALNAVEQKAVEAAKVSAITTNQSAPSDSLPCFQTTSL
jgi:hypothetical protein